MGDKDFVPSWPDLPPIVGLLLGAGIGWTQRIRAPKWTTQILVYIAASIFAVVVWDTVLMIKELKKMKKLIAFLEQYINEKKEE